MAFDLTDLARGRRRTRTQTSRGHDFGETRSPGPDFPDYVRKVRLACERTRARRRKYLGPELVAGLTGRAWTITHYISHRDLVSNDGALFLIRYLEEHLGRVPVPDAGTKAEQLFVCLRRPLNMSMATWCSTVREHYRGLQRALKRARKEQDDNRTGSERMSPVGTSPSRIPPPRTPTPTPSSPPSRDGRARGVTGPSEPPYPLQPVAGPARGQCLSLIHPAQRQMNMKVSLKRLRSRLIR